MALINCPECNREVSNMAESCPGCGCPGSELLKAEADASAGDTVYEPVDVDASENIVSLAARLLEQETSPEVQKIKLDILRRIATESDIKPARIPAPLNITEIGGYINLMMKLKKEESLQQQRILDQLLKGASSEPESDLRKKLVFSKEQEKDFTGMVSRLLTSILGLPATPPIE